MKQSEFLGLQIYKEERTLSLSEEKLNYIIQQCQEVYSQPRTLVLNMAKLIGLLTLMVQAVLKGKIQFRFLQQEQIFSLKKHWSYQGYVILGKLVRQEPLC